MVPDARSHFAPKPGSTYLDWATYGLPPEPTVRAMRAALDAWQAGTADWIADWDRPAEGARATFGRLVGTGPERVALLPAVSVGAGLIAATLGPADRVVVPDDEFTSILFPLLVAEERGATVRQVPFEGVVEAIVPGTTLVAVSLVQMQTGRMADLAAIVGRAEAVGARVLVDGTQAVPLVPLHDLIDRIDYLVVAGYKHLLCPRGVAFLVVRPGRVDGLPPLLANWRAADQPYGRYFGGPLTLADGAARYDVSLAWLPWVGAVESLRLLAEWQESGELERARRLAGSLADRLGVPWHGASLVCPPIDDADAARVALRDAGIRAAVRGTAIRFSTHVGNDEADIDRAAALLGAVAGH
jgi:selenocysteine lyase/cysteine desulfurase